MLLLQLLPLLCVRAMNACWLKGIGSIQIHPETRKRNDDGESRES
jgi:hypothetical protein